MNILVTGANGQLGTEMRLKGAGSGHRFIFTDINDVPGFETVHLDILDADAVKIVCESEAVDVIVNCAAYTNVDAAESNEDMAYALNCEAVSNLADAAASMKASLIHISTDYVFPGNSCTPLSENTPASPCSVYGSTKLAGERKVINSGCNYIILRTAWLYSPWGKNFVKTIRQLASARSEIKVVYDQVGTPTYAGDLASAIIHILDKGMLDRRGTYHFTDEGAVSWYDFANAITEMSGSSCRVLPCLSSEFPSKVNRPHYSVLDKSLFRTTFAYDIPYWRDSLRDCITRLEK